MPYHKPVPQWNIIFLIYAELVDSATAKVKGDNTSADLCELESNILKVTLCGNFNLFAIKHTIKINGEGEFSESVCISILDVDEKGNNLLKQLSCPSAKNFLQNSESIRDIFQWIDQNYPADKNLLFTWGHGSAFGIFKQTLFDNQYVTTDTLKLLNNHKLAEAILSGFKNQQAEAVIMFNCDMQNMHTCHALQNCVKYLVAPQGAINAPGYNYVSIINLIGENNRATGEMVAMHAVETFMQNAIIKSKTAMAQKCALFAVCLTGYDEKITAYMKFLVDELLALIEDTPALCADIRSFRENQYSYGYNLGYFLADLNNFLLKLTKRNNSARLSHLRDALLRLWKPMVIAEAIGNNVYFDAVAPWEKVAHIKPTGMSIYFPPNATNLNNPIVKTLVVAGAPNFSALMGQIKWMEFLNALYKNPIP